MSFQSTSMFIVPLTIVNASDMSAQGVTCSRLPRHLRQMFWPALPATTGWTESTLRESPSTDPDMSNKWLGDGFGDSEAKDENAPESSSTFSFAFSTCKFSSLQT